MEDSTRTYEVAIFSIVYSRYEHLTVAMCPFAFEGRVQDGFGACILIADKVKVLQMVITNTQHIQYLRSTKYYVECK